MDMWKNRRQRKVYPFVKLKIISEESASCPSPGVCFREKMFKNIIGKSARAPPPWAYIKE